MLKAFSFFAALVLSLPAYPAQDEPVELLEYQITGRTDTDGPRPVLLALPPGNQSQRMVEFGEQLYWKSEATRLGWTVISPMAPGGQSLSGSNITRVLELVEHVQNTYEVETGKVHVAGVSNGGRTALELALTDPEGFASLSLLPGMQRDITSEQIDSLAGLPIAMYVGGNDTGWLVPMTAMANELTELGYPPAVFRVFEGEGHTPASLTGEMLFEALESFRTGEK